MFLHYWDGVSQNLILWLKPATFRGYPGILAISLRNFRVLQNWPGCNFTNNWLLHTNTHVLNRHLPSWPLDLEDVLLKYPDDTNKKVNLPALQVFINDSLPSKSLNKKLRWKIRLATERGHDTWGTTGGNRIFSVMVLCHLFVFKTISPSNEQSIIVPI